MDHPPYSPDLAPSDFFYSEKKRQLKGRRFQDRDEICAVTEEWLLAQPPHFYFEGQDQMAEMYSFRWWLG